MTKSKTSLLGHFSSIHVKSSLAYLIFRRKINIRSSIVSDPIIVPSNFMAAINRYMNTEVDDVSCLIAKFFHMFLMRSPYLEPHEVDNFILKNGSMLCNW